MNSRRIKTSPQVIIISANIHIGYTLSKKNWDPVTLRLEALQRRSL